ncbi:FAD-binding domain-containing protein [Synechococcus sp. A15-44]|uniref:FAD-binding domain-containing protein n=1 Tax=Synechococcus sp. A15-44 TaxID=1050646 RepID=UPI0016490E24|nr:FAD-binding domain-containing protein [Synechococcus sp. A15-44]QNI63172.1 deoxyribodipyrimidine photolyase (DNA photolyase) (photoreactivating enzyme) [Synechococcus sp. A15-44]
MITSRVLFWHRRDLRLADNLGLIAAAEISPAVTGVYVLDPKVINPPEHLPPMAPARLWFLIESLVELQQRWRDAGSRLLVLEGDPVAVLPQMAQQIDAEAVVWNRDVEPYSRERDRQVAKKLQADGRKVVVDWDQLLIAPELLKTGGGDPYRVYGPFLRNWRGQVLATQPSAVAAPTGLVDLDSAQVPAGDPLEVLRGSHGFKGVEICPCRPGEAAALGQLTTFCDGPLLGYEPDRNFPGTPGTSYLSAALSVGTLSPRQAWCAAQDSREQARSEEHLQAIAVWEQELGWREFYQQALFHFPELADGPYREQWRRFPWENNEDWFDFWKEGQTGMPIIDAAMRQLNQTGWMHNRCRMIVASYLVKDLICDWRWGERAFMELEVDGDLAANNGGWQWSASSGMDPKPLRIFNPATQASKFDSAGDYIRQWVPELRHVNTKDLLSGEIGALERRDYPEPLVNHKTQQAKFKALYATIRS